MAGWLEYSITGALAHYLNKRVVLAVVMCILCGVVGYKGGEYRGSYKSDAVMSQIEQAAYQYGMIKMATAIKLRCDGDHNIGGPDQEFHYYCAPVKSF